MFWKNRSVIFKCKNSYKVINYSYVRVDPNILWTLIFLKKTLRVSLKLYLDAATTQKHTALKKKEIEKACLKDEVFAFVKENGILNSLSHPNYFSISFSYISSFHFKIWSLCIPNPCGWFSFGPPSEPSGFIADEELKKLDEKWVHFFFKLLNFDFVLIEKKI